MNLSLLIHTALLATQPHWERMGDHFRSSTNDGMSNLLAVAAITIGFAIGVFLLAQFAESSEKTKAVNSPAVLFRELCNVHRLDRGDRRLLKRLAAARAVPQPAHLFINPHHLKLDGLPAEWKSEEERLRQLHRRLYEPRRRRPLAPSLS